MAEETSNSATAAPRGIIRTVFATGLGGFALILALLFATTDLEAVTNGVTGVAAADLFLLVGGKVWGAALTWLILVNFFFAGLASVAVTGRITFALSRDNAFPYSEFLKKVHPVLKSPINSMCFVFMLDALIMLLPLDPAGGSSAFLAIIGLCTIGFQVRAL